MELSKPQQIALIAGVIVLVVVAVVMGMRFFSDSTPTRDQASSQPVQTDPLPAGRAASEKPRMDRGAAATR